MEIQSIKIINEDEFFKKFICQKNHLNTNAGFDGCMYETYGKELDYVFEMRKLNRVITIVEADLDKEFKTFIDDSGNKVIETIPNLYYASGFHSINRLGFFILNKPYEYEFEVKIE